MPRPFQIFSQSIYLIQIVDINSQTEWQIVQIQISWLLRSQLIWIYTVCKGRVYPGSAGQGLKNQADDKCSPKELRLSYELRTFCHIRWIPQNIQNCSVTKYEQNKSMSSKIQILDHKYTNLKMTTIKSNICFNHFTRVSKMDPSISELGHIHCCK